MTDHPTPDEAIRILRQHAVRRGLPPNDNDFDDAANVIARLQSSQAMLEEAGKVLENAAQRLIYRGALASAQDINAFLAKLRERQKP